MVGVGVGSAGEAEHPFADEVRHAGLEVVDWSAMPVVLAFCSAMVYGVGDWFGGRASRRQPSLVVAAVGQAVSLVFVVVVVAVMGTAVPDAATWGWGAFGGVVGALGIAGLYHGFAHGDISVVAPVSAVVGVVLPVVVGLALGERPSPLALVGIGLAVVAVALVSGALGTHQHNTPPRIVALAVGVGACFGLLFVAFDRTDPDSGLWPLVAARLASVPLLVVLIAVTRSRVVARPRVADHRRSGRRVRHGGERVVPGGGEGGDAVDRVGDRLDVPGEHGGARVRHRQGEARQVAGSWPGRRGACSRAGEPQPPVTGPDPSTTSWLSRAAAAKIPLLIRLGSLLRRAT